MPPREPAEQPADDEADDAREQRDGAVEPDRLAHEVGAHGADDGAHGDPRGPRRGSGSARRSRRRPAASTAMRPAYATARNVIAIAARMIDSDRRCPGHVGEHREAVEHPERDQVHRHERVGERVEARTSP